MSFSSILKEDLCSFFIFFFETIANIPEIFTLTPKLIYHRINFKGKKKWGQFYFWLYYNSI